MQQSTSKELRRINDTSNEAHVHYEYQLLARESDNKYEWHEGLSKMHVLFYTSVSLPKACIYNAQNSRGPLSFSCPFRPCGIQLRSIEANLLHLNIVISFDDGMQWDLYYVKKNDDAFAFEILF